MPVVRISDKTWGRLKAWATPLEDTPDSTIRKLLDRVEPNGAPKDQATTDATDAQAGAKRLPRGKKTSERAFERPLLEALYELGGAGVMYQVLPVVEEKLRHVLKDVDYAPGDMFHVEVRVPIPVDARSDYREFDSLP